ncbi:NADH-quinone oxidoreductase subunit NuoE [Leptolinea tardivitalis]|uniref:NADH dehydrogenase n=1 Tax=Leptolinea tardivitalis TaxID=229920 RepID=A0A0P6X127_9CHLR|nr:NADH-quinone oxidoreductase subunit NuoE [Leptolinea tardivitalis]KPL72949.1 NADH dehydrogenase [Leptolinea tardivitalis]GAP20653.1 NADH:ubiquinone oxidoreductase 24 kD subunit [Leptolinea tardivitalis]
MTLDKFPANGNPIQYTQGDLIPLLQSIQERAGYLSPENVSEVARKLHISENEVYGVASFYTQFRFNAPGRHSIKICLGTACHVRSGQKLMEAIERELHIKPGETTSDGLFDLQRVACLGCCALAPVMQIDDQIFGRVTATRLKHILESYA